MARNIGIGHQDFEDIRVNGDFYIDKTDFIKEWWESRDSVTLITRPRRFGKTLTMSMVEKFFSIAYAGRKDLLIVRLGAGILPKPAGDLSGDQFIFCQCERSRLQWNEAVHSQDLGRYL